MQNRKSLNVGVVGCGNISEIYFKMSKIFPVLNVCACADLDMKRAEEKAKAHNLVPMTPKELYADRNIDIVLNLTLPKSHFEVDLAALKNGKHVYGEKPLGIDLGQGKTILETAKKLKLRVGSAPDTFLGAGIQTCRKIIDSGLIGRPVAAEAFMIGHGHEHWHPSPEFYYQRGGGPMLDMGPYYLTALVNLLGPAKLTAGVAVRSMKERVITSKPKFGKRFKVETPTHLTGAVEFKSGAVATLIMSFDVWKSTLPRIEVHGTEGSMIVPDPNTFGGPISLFNRKKKIWEEVPLRFIYGENTRSLGLADMAQGILSGRKHRASGELAYHVLETMLSFEESYKTGKHIMLKSTCEKPAAFPLKMKKGILDR
ncbi:MAG: Gfo/Idh/MocA family oxidoreductase [Candidatus Firestonebacteria bacterium]|nr:Gfo/Idh/MocA family oxidoreductase [Candidatus Firestonebacteria bacterium]